MSMNKHIDIPYYPYGDGMALRESFISVFPKTIVTGLLSVITFTGNHLPLLTFTCARGAHKRDHENIYSYHRVQNLYQLFKIP